MSVAVRLSRPTSASSSVASDADSTSSGAAAKRGLRHSLKLNRMLLSELDDFAALISQESEEREEIHAAFTYREESTETLTAMNFVEDQAAMQRRTIRASERKDWVMLIRMEREAVQYVYVDLEPLDAVERELIDSSTGLVSSSGASTPFSSRPTSGAARRPGSAASNKSSATIAAPWMWTSMSSPIAVSLSPEDKKRAALEHDDDVPSVMSSDSDESPCPKKSKSNAQCIENEPKGQSSDEEEGSTSPRPPPPRPMSATRQRLLAVKEAREDRTRRRSKILRMYNRTWKGDYSRYLNERRNIKRDNVLLSSTSHERSMMDLELMEATRAEYVRSQSELLLSRLRSQTLEQGLTEEEHEAQVALLSRRAQYVARGQERSLWAQFMQMWVYLASEEKSERSEVAMSDAAHWRLRAERRLGMENYEGDERLQLFHTENHDRHDIENNFYSATAVAREHDQRRIASRLSRERREQTVRFQHVNLYFEDLLSLCIQQEGGARRLVEDHDEVLAWSQLLANAQTNVVAIHSTEGISLKLRQVEADQNKKRTAILWLEQDWRREMMSKLKKLRLSQ